MEAVFLKVLNMSITASWFVLAVLLLRPFIKKAQKWIMGILWGFIAIRLICPFSIQSTLSLIPSAETVPKDILLSDTPAITSGLSFINQTINPILSGTLSPKSGDSVNPMQIITFTASIVWIIGISVMLIYMLISFLRIAGKVREAAPLQDNIRVCDYITTPFIFGLFRPRIYLPSSMNKADIHYVLAHEKAHLKRKDHIWKPLGFLLLTVYWFNPILWAAYYLLCKDIELACDEKVLREFGTEIKKPYSDALINCSAPRKMIVTCPLAFGEVGVKERILNILNYKKPAFWVVITAVIACIAAAVCFLTNPKEAAPDNLSKVYGAHSWFEATVLEINKESILVRPDENFDESKSADKISVSLDVMSTDILPEMKVGDRVQIGYYGNVGETFPAQINKTSIIYNLDEYDTDAAAWSTGGGRTGPFYCYEDAPGTFKPNVSLLPHNTFEFRWSLLDNYYAVGNYDLTDTTLTLITGDGKYKYIFDVAGDTFIFNEGESSQLPRYRMKGVHSELFSPIPDKAVFTLSS